MRVKNNTRQRIPRKWLQRILNHLGVNPEITIDYCDNPDTTESPNFRHDDTWNGVNEVDGLATYENRVYLYVGKWVSGKFYDWTPRYLKWILAHELRHQYYFYHIGNPGDPWKGLGPTNKERAKGEERACNRFANLIVGVPGKDFPVRRKDVDKKNTKSSK